MPVFDLESSFSILDRDISTRQTFPALEISTRRAANAVAASPYLVANYYHGCWTCTNDTV